MKRCMRRHAARPAKGTNVVSGTPATRSAAMAARPPASLRRVGRAATIDTNEGRHASLPTSCWLLARDWAVMTWSSLCEPKRAGPSGGEHNEDDQTDRSERDGEELGRLEAGKDRGLVAQKEQAEPDHRNGNEVDGRGGAGAKIGQTLTADPQKDKEARKRECFIGLGRLESDVVGRHRRRVSVDECPGERGRDPRRIACDD